jgi:CHASE3 domain sensor protein
MTIARKLTYAFGVVLLLMGIMVVLAIFSLFQARQTAEELIEIQQVVQAVDSAVGKVFEERVALDSYFFTGKESGKAQFERAYDEYEAAWAVVKNHRGDEIPQLLTEIEQKRVTNYNLYYNALVFHETTIGDLQKVMDQMSQADVYYEDTLGPALAQFRDSELERAQHLSTSAQRLFTTMLITAAIAGALALTIAVFAAHRIGSGINQAAVHLSEAADSISRGDLDVAIQVDTGDEMQRLAESIERMRTSLKAAIERLRSR